LKLNLYLGAIASLQLAASFALQLIVLAVLGAGTDTAALVAAQAVPGVVFSVLAISLQKHLATETGSVVNRSCSVAKRARYSSRPSSIVVWRDGTSLDGDGES
jgi:1-aminocyclopropane-1-carboxylate deaminase/D-cysteine desulfhydrase-like pyridoxal-dependent ACC family enzyme